jgi:hypothetical protein
MHNIHDIKSICGQILFIFKMKCEKGYPKYKLQNYKSTQK